MLFSSSMGPTWTLRVSTVQSASRAVMDRIEGAGRGPKSNYRLQRHLVRTGGNSLWAVTYAGTEEGRRRFQRRADNESSVSVAYFRHLVQGAVLFCFPVPYLIYLRRMAGK